MINDEELKALDEYGKEHFAGLSVDYVRFMCGQSQLSFCRILGIDPEYYKNSVVMSKDFMEIDIVVIFKLYYFTKEFSENIYFPKYMTGPSKDASILCSKVIEDYMNRIDDRDYLPSKNRTRTELN